MAALPLASLHLIASCGIHSYIPYFKRIFM